jgi:hypothetical protein
MSRGEAFAFRFGQATEPVAVDLEGGGDPRSLGLAHA